MVTVLSKTHYETLGVAKNASMEEVRKAYRKLVLRYHPDSSQEPAALERFLAITGAYEVLSDWERRRHYDQLLALEAQRAAVQMEPERSGHERAKSAAHAKTHHGGRTAVISAELTRLTLMHSRGQSAQAEKLAHKILHYDNRQPIPYAVLGDLSRSRGDLRNAAKMYAMAVQMDPRNPIYQQRHEELVRGPAPTMTKQSEAANASRQTTALVSALALVMLAATYLVLSQEQALVHRLKPVSTWTLGVWVMAFVSGVVVGVALSIGELVDRFLSIATTSVGRISPVVALASIAIVNFWVAAGVYLFLGLTQGGFNYSTSRVLVATACVTLLLSLGAHFSAGIDAWQVFAWSGNLTYIGALCGWMVADSLRR